MREYLNMSLFVENWVVTNVLGSCKYLELFVEDFCEETGIQDEDYALELLEKACEDAGIFRCDECGWWVEYGDYCESCASEEDD